MSHGLIHVFELSIPPLMLLILMVIAMQISHQVWMTLLNNFAASAAKLDGAGIEYEGVPQQTFFQSLLSLLVANANIPAIGKRIVVEPAFALVDEDAGVVDEAVG